jgi:nucleotide-binding universal stress UspA family protein
VETRIENGDPRDVICQAVQKMGVDILVMGSHGYGVIKRSVFDNSYNTYLNCKVIFVRMS